MCLSLHVNRGSKENPRPSSLKMVTRRLCIVTASVLWLGFVSLSVGMRFEVLNCLYGFMRIRAIRSSSSAVIYLSDYHASHHLLRQLVLLEKQTHKSPQLGGIHDGQDEIENLEPRTVEQRCVLPSRNGYTDSAHAFSNFSF